MKKNKLDKIIEAFRNNRIIKEEIANAVGNAGYQSGGDQTVAGFDPLLGGKDKKKKNGTLDLRKIKPNFRRWIINK